MRGDVSVSGRGDLWPSALLAIGLAAYIAVVYAIIVVAAGTAAGPGSANGLLTIVATAIVAVTFAPVRVRLTGAINRLVYGKRATPYEILSQFADRVAQTYASEEVLSNLARTITDGIGGAHTQIWLRVEDDLRLAAEFPGARTPDTPLPLRGNDLPKMPGGGFVGAVRHMGDLLGAITATKRGGEPLNPVESRLLSDIASQAGPVLRNVRLTAELEAHLLKITTQAEELRVSRRRIVAAHDAERRRLERDIHDGAQQHLVALAVKARLASTVVGKRPDKLDEMLAELRSVTDGALDTLRNLSRGIYPAGLQELGVAQALAAHAHIAGLDVEVKAKDFPRYEPDVEATLYFVCLEALQNTSKYSGAAGAIVLLDRTPSSIRFSVRDDGHGFDPATVKRGAGLENMGDRLAAAGGSLLIQSSPGKGTLLSGEIQAVPVGD
ncbi:MAG: histidine kinase [Actinobacteria bacterium]|nr:histidine kinase [Actinomycetota bacterium]